MLSDRPALRIKLRKQRRKLDPASRREANAAICHTIRELAAYQSAERIAVYLAFDGEADPSGLISEDKKVYIPVLQGRDERMRFARYEAGTELVRNEFGILEPAAETNGDNDFPASRLDLVIAPLVGFDPKCNRLGVGGGFYDRTFAFMRRDPNSRNQTPTRPVMIGFAYELQKLTSIETCDWDIALDAVVTESTIYQRRSLA